MENLQNENVFNILEKNNMKKILIILLFVINCVVLNCCYMSNQPPLSTRVSGRWMWEKTINNMDKILDKKTYNNNKELSHVDALNGEYFFQKLFFYENGFIVDSLINYDTKSGIMDEKNNQVIQNYKDFNDSSVVIRYTFYFNNRKSSPTGMEINIQRNSETYIEANDTIRMVYSRLE